MILSKCSERLYLQKDSIQNIHIKLFDTLPQHQIDGIRFLFMLYKKKAPGVILNDPSGYGKCLQVTLFVNALRPILKNPVLILSDSVANWKSHFEAWTDCGDDELAIETTNPFIKKSIFINQVKDGLAFGRRTWSIVILHDEEATKQFLALNIRADYKIWVTKEDLKDNLHNLASIYEWLHPNQKFNVFHFTAKSHDARDAIEKAILLDAFSEDFLLRRNDFYFPFEKPECYKPIKAATPSPVKATRKNKDPTGTKVKRSKKRLIKEQDAEANTNTVENDTLNNNCKIKALESPENKDNMDVESFIRNERPIRSEDFKFIQDKSDTLTVTVNVPETSNLNFEDFTRQNNSENYIINDQSNIFHYTETITQDNENVNKVLVPDTEDVSDSQSIFQSNTEMKVNHHDNDSEVKQTGVFIPETEDEPSINSYNERNIVKDSFCSETHNENKTNDSMNNQDISKTEIFKDTSKNWNLNDSQNAKLSDNNFQNENISQDAISAQDSTDWKIDIIKKENGLGNESSDKCNSESINENGSKGDNIAKNDSKIAKNEVLKRKNTDDFDAKLAEMEEKALKRLKGSILDSLF